MPYNMLINIRKTFGLFIVKYHNNSFCYQYCADNGAKCDDLKSQFLTNNGVSLFSKSITFSLSNVVIPRSVQSRLFSAVIIFSLMG